MKCTGRYYEPVARELSQDSFFVSAVNPQIIRNFQGQDNPLRRAKTDKADSVKIARNTLDSWDKLKQYTLMDELRSQLLLSSDLYVKNQEILSFIVQMSEPERAKDRICLPFACYRIWQQANENRGA